MNLFIGVVLASMLPMVICLIFGMGYWSSHRDDPPGNWKDWILFFLHCLIFPGVALGLFLLTASFMAGISLIDEYFK